MIHTVKGFSVVNEGEVDVFLELSCVFDVPENVGNLISCFSAFSKTAWTSGSSWFTYCWSLAQRTLSITLLACEMSAIVQLFEHSLTLPFFGIGLKMDLFQSCGHCWVFQICWHIECNSLIASCFRIRNSSTGIPSPSLALFVVMLLRPTWLYIPGCLALGEWSHHCGIWVMKMFLLVLLCIFFTSFNIFCFC